MSENLKAGARLPGCDSSFLCLAGQPQANYLTSLCVSFLKREIDRKSSNEKL